MRALGRVTQVGAIGLTLISLIVSQFTVGGQQSQPSPSIPKPSAAWLSAPPNPLSIGVTLAQDSSVTETVRTRGGEIRATAPDGTRFTLTIPNGALHQSAEITMTPIADVNNLPLGGGLVAAVQISPEDIVFSETPTLVVQPRARLSPTEQIDFVSFAYRGNGQEFHLYPIETNPKRLEFKLLRFGGFGIGRGTEADQEKVRLRLPTDSTDRIMMEMQKLKSILRKRLLTKPVARLATEDAEWRIVKTSFNATEPRQQQSGELTAAMRREIVNKLREAYHQDVMPKIKGLKFECKSNMMIRVREALGVAQGWLKAVELMGLVKRISQDDVTDEEKEMLIRDRVAAEGLIGAEYQRRIRNFNRGGMVVTETELRRIERDRLRNEGYNDQEIEELLREAESNREEFRKMSDELNRLIWETLKKAYDKAHQCCLQEAKDFYLAMMDWAARVLSISGQEAAVSMEKRNECLCAIESVSAGQSGAWSGQITHTESFKDVREETIPGPGMTRQNKHHKTHDYRAVINLVYFLRGASADADGARLPGQVSANGTVQSTAGREDRWTSSSTEKRQGSERKEEYEGNLRGEELDVEVSIRPDGTYSVSYNAPCADASGTSTTRTYVEGTGFPEFQKKDESKSQPINRNVCPTQPGMRLSDGQFVGITGKVDPKNLKTLTGSKTFDVPLDENPKVNKRITITWDLKRCR